MDFFELAQQVEELYGVKLEQDRIYQIRQSLKNSPGPHISDIYVKRPDIAIFCGCEATI